MQLKNKAKREKFLQSNANLGPSKLALLTEIPFAEREEFVEQNDLAGMTVEKVKALVEENNAKGEQINMLNNELEESAHKLFDANNEIAELEKELEAENERLKDYNENLQTANTALSEEILEAKTEAYKECIKKVKALFPSDNEPYQYWEIHEGADNLLKELVGDNGES